MGEGRRESKSAAFQKVRRPLTDHYIGGRRGVEGLLEEIAVNGGSKGGEHCVVTERDVEGGEI